MRFYNQVIFRNYTTKVTSVSEHDYKLFPGRMRGWKVESGKLMRRYDDIYAIKFRKIIHPGYFTKIGPSGTVRADIEGKLVVRRELAETSKYIKSNDLRDMSEQVHVHIFPNLPPIKVKFDGFRKSVFKNVIQD